MLPSGTHFSSSCSTAASATARPTRCRLSAGVRRTSHACALCSHACCRSSGERANPESSEEAWALMGRVVQSERLELSNTSRQRLVLLAAARQAGVTPEFMAAALQELATLLPDLASLLPSLSPAVLAPLAADTAAVAHKLIRLRLLFPAADVGRMISRRPMLLLDDQFDQVETARAKLLARLTLTQPAAADVQQPSGASAGPPPQQQPSGAGTSPHQQQPPEQPSGAGTSPPQQQQQQPEQRAGTQLQLQQSCPALDALVSQQPLLLVAHVDELLDELERLLPSTHAMAALQRDPELLTSVCCTRNLSLWLMPGVLVLPLLQSNPSLLLSVQRGSSDLGPGAEFMGPG